MKEKAKELVEVVKQIKNIQALLDNLKTKREELESSLFIIMNKEGYDKLSINGATIYPTSRMYVSLPQTDEALEYVKQIGLGDLIRETIPSQTLTASVKEILQENPDAIEDIKQHLKVAVKEKVGVRFSKNA